jgi:glycyl-tRNA synthetase beta chain
MNIIKGHYATEINEGLLQDGAERNLYEAFAEVQEETEPYLQAKEYGKALDVILRMKEPVDLFFDEVMVMSDDADLQKNRLNLLTAISGLFLQIGDFSKMQSSVK